ncbi:DUF4167 domain-containing protein [Skermanella sp. TT6]|uniref:DUF4167 domain-containing protein n=1 Tax=Skermanella cutis TaxID=2775420 RepID=UPI001FFFEEEF|nr:DUF4167 domain-containing protein [Skermanella sp. TT6]
MRHHRGTVPTKDAKVPPPRHNRPSFRSQNRAPGLDGGNPERVRGDAMTKHARYLDLAQDAKAAGDEITAQGHLQYAEHWYRTAMADRRPPEPVEDSAVDDGQPMDPGPGGQGPGGPGNMDRKPRRRGQRTGPLRRRPPPPEG